MSDHNSADHNSADHNPSELTGPDHVWSDPSGSEHTDVPPLEPEHDGVGWPPEGEAEPTEPAEPAPVQRRRRRVSAAGAVIALLLGLLGFALVVQVQSNTGDNQLENARQEDLVRILSDLNSREERLRTEISGLEGTLSQLGAGAQGQEAALAEARRRADELGILAGSLAAEGEGLTIRILPRDTSVRASTVLEAVEELRGAGAEAMQIAGVTGPAVRIIASTYFADGARGLIVDGLVLPAPYMITVIGPAATMKTALLIPGGVSDSVARDGGTVLLDEATSVRVDALAPPSVLQYAKPVQ
jgi:uncharacterized protein YlxW (UPF0749 family)